MAKKTVLYVRMDEQLKRDGEELFRRLGTSLPEAVRIFVKKSVSIQGMPFRIETPKHTVFGRLSSYANTEFIAEEKSAFKTTIRKKHMKTAEQ